MDHGKYTGYAVNDSSGNGSERAWLLAHEGHNLEYQDRAAFEYSQTHRMMACHDCRQILLMSKVKHLGGQE